MKKLGYQGSETPEDMTLLSGNVFDKIFFLLILESQVVTFAVAETGSVCLVTNEGNARMTTTLPPKPILPLWEWSVLRLLLKKSIH